MSKASCAYKKSQINFPKLNTMHETQLLYKINKLKVSFQIFNFI